MSQHLALVSIVVPDYDKAIEFYTEKLGFVLKENIDMGRGKRWVVVRPSGSGGVSLLLAKAKNNAEMAAIGNQTGGRVFLFLHTDDFWRDYKNYQANGIHFLEQPREEAYGTVVVFQDQFGNKWDLIQPSTSDLDSQIP
ncbi:MAG: VOC family protein [Saprospiraceae bacterium]|nr:VOC family protein [Saprospiraceae bacterium]